MSAQSRRDILTNYDPESPVAAELRRIYQNMIVATNGDKKKSFVFSSAVGGEGKSTLVSHIALTIANYRNRKVLVVDADMRRARIHHIFGLNRGPGLYECLAEEADPMQIAQKTKLDNLDVLTAGAMNEFPSSLFESDGLSALFEKVEFYYDVILIDSPPVLAVSDTLFLCNEIKTVIYVLMAGVTPREVVFRAMRALNDSKANVLGVVVNNAARALPYYYEPKYYEYGYGTE